MTANHWLFFRRWIRNPLKIGAVMPSGRSLSGAMARAVDPDGEGLVVELGGGTGSITMALLERIPEDRLIVVERDPTFHALLTERFPGIRVLRGEATALTGLMTEHGLTGNGGVAAVVSGLPLLSMTRSQQEAILRESFALLRADGAYIQFTYGPKVPVPDRLRKSLGLKATNLGHTTNNVPPATVWKLERAASGN